MYVTQQGASNIFEPWYYCCFFLNRRVLPFQSK